MPQQLQIRVLWIALYILGFGASLAVYVLGLPVSISVALAAAVPAVHVALRICQSHILAYAVTFTPLMALWETGEFGKGDLLFDSEPTFADVLEELYSDRAETVFERALQVTRCKMDPDKWNSRVCPKLRSIPDGELLKLFEKGFATGVKGNEDQLYTYAVVLALSNANSTEIDAAVAAWRKSFPASTAPDPREYARSVRR